MTALKAKIRTRNRVLHHPSLDIPAKGRTLRILLSLD